MTQAEDEARFLREVLPPRRDPITGLYPTVPGRPRRQTLRNQCSYNFNKIVTDYIEAHGGFVEDVVIDIFRSMLAAARLGDMAAAKLLLDRFCGKDAELIDVTLTTSKLSDTERATRLEAILAAAGARAQASRQRITVERGGRN